MPARAGRAKPSMRCATSAITTLASGLTCAGPPRAAALKMPGAGPGVSSTSPRGGVPDWPPIPGLVAVGDTIWSGGPWLAVTRGSPVTCCCCCCWLVGTALAVLGVVGRGPRGLATTLPAGTGAGAGAGAEAVVAGRGVGGAAAPRGTEPALARPSSSGTRVPLGPPWAALLLRVKPWLRLPGTRGVNRERTQKRAAACVCMQ